MNQKEIVIFWFRRDLRLDDNIGLLNALKSGLPVLPIFIFDEKILANLPKNDARVNFIHDNLQNLNEKLNEFGSSILVKYGEVAAVWSSLIEDYNVKAVFFNKDYEPAALKRDNQIIDYLKDRRVAHFDFKDQVIFEQNEIVKNDGLPYTVYTPFKNKWLEHFQNLPQFNFEEIEIYANNFLQIHVQMPDIEQIGFVKSSIKVFPHNLTHIKEYHAQRDFPALDSTNYLSPHLRFGTVSIRKLVIWANKKNQTFLSELIWREFFMQILFHFPYSAKNNFKASYNGIVWRNNENEFEKWCNGQTGYPMVDAGMRQLNATGYMHNRVRMVVASFLCKHLLINWQWGEAYFAEKLLDFEQSANVGNWQWAAGTGCDAAPYFRVFNPEIQMKKFDPDLIYVKKWIKDFKPGYLEPIVEHSFARDRAIAAYKKGIAN